MKHLLLSLGLLLATPAWADSLCGVTDPARLATLAGVWLGDQSISLEGLESSRMQSSPDDISTLTVGPDGTLQMTSKFFASLTDAGLPLILSRQGIYDVDRVDDVLDTVERSDIADDLSDTRCGPEALPQLVATVVIGDGVTVEGTVTLIPYFSDRMLQIFELDLQSEDALIHLTATALLRPRDATD